MASDDRQPGTASIDLIVATVGREGELTDLVASVRDQAPVDARVIVVDQNDDDRVGEALRRQPDRPEIVHLHAQGGVSHARNTGQALVTAPIVAWPDDDCVYPAGLLPHVVAQFAADPGLDVLVGRIEDPSGGSGILATLTEPKVLDSRSVWRYPSAPTFFARRDAAVRVGAWSTSFGPGGTTPWDAGEDSDWLIRAVEQGLCVRFDPAVRVLHKDPFLTGSPEALRRARRYGRCTSAVALTHGYGLRFVALLVVRSLGRRRRVTGFGSTRACGSPPSGDARTRRGRGRIQTSSTARRRNRRARRCIPASSSTSTILINR